MIGNPSDPATPFAESVELVEDTLSNGYLLEADHPDHVVYLRDNRCVDAFVHDALLRLVLPEERRSVCERLGPAPDEPELTG
ncbi:MAG: alpha/beta hydrolase [Actinomycetota bacterium]